MSSRIDQFRSMLAKQPENELFHFSLAQALLAERRQSEALAHLEFCIAKRADWMMPRVILGKLLIQLGHRARAGEVLRQALALALAQHHEEPERELRETLAALESPPGRFGG